MAKYAYTEEGKAAIVVLATMMIKADGRTDPKEIDLSLIFFNKLNVGSKALNLSKTMTPSEALLIVNKMTLEEKKLVRVILSTILAADGEMDDRELAILTTVSLVANIPQVLPDEGRKILEELYMV
ncbi:MAG: TerB family tellurite resistance protein [Alistipes sp.]|nr:TerB family tellurite resistance protein [Alistipes sp.]